MNTETYSDETDITCDEVLQALTTEHRRTVLEVLVDDGQGEMGLERLVDGVVERLSSDDRPVMRRREQTSIDLSHVHLPKLDSHDIVEWDAESEVVTVGPEFERVVSVLARIRDGGQQC